MSDVYDPEPDQNDDDRSQSQNPGQTAFNNEIDRAYDRNQNTGETTKQNLQQAEQDSVSNDGRSSNKEAPGTNNTDQIRSKEKTGDNVPAADTEDKTDEDDKKLGRLKRLRRRKAKLKSRVRKRLALIGASILAVLTPLLLLLAFLLLAFKIPHFMANVTAWQFAKITHMQAVSLQNVVAEDTALEGAPDGFLASLKDRYSNLRDNTLHNLEKISGSIIVRNMQAANKIAWKQTERSGVAGSLGFKRTTAITINDRSVLIPSEMFSYTGKYLHPIQTLKTKFAFYNAVDDAFRVYNPEVGWTVRSRAAGELLTSRLGNTSFRGILMANFLNKKNSDAAAEAQAEVYRTAEPKVDVPDSAPDEIKQAANDMAKAEEDCVSNPDCLKASATSSDGLVPTAVDGLVKKITSTAASLFLQAARGAINIANPLYNVALPLCLVYSGSIQNPKATNDQGASLMRMAVQMLAINGQIKRGDINSLQVDNGVVNSANPTTTDLKYNVNSDGVGAMGQKLDGPNGDGILNSNAMLRAAGKNPYTNQPGLSTQQTAFGSYGSTTIFDALLPSIVAGPMDKAANDVCPTATNIWAGAAIGAANLVILGVTAMSSAGAGAAAEYGSEEGAEVAANAGMKLLVDKVVSTFTTKAGATQAFSKGGKAAYDFYRTVKRTTYLLEGATLLARLITSIDSGAMNNGLANGETYANQIDDGTNLLATTICQGVEYGRFLSLAEVAQSDIQDAQIRQAAISKQSTYQRYFALSNPDSMLTKFGEATVMRVNRHSIANAFSSLTNVFNPMSFVPHLFGNLPSKAAKAADVASENYGNVQCGYSTQEFALINNTAPGADGSYSSPLENAYRFEAGGEYVDNQIDKEYGPCFTASVGDLMSQKDSDGHTYLIRESPDGEISPDSVCSPQNLGTNNPQFGDLVFRYRLEHLYNTTIHDMYGVQTAGQNPTGQLAT